MQSNPHTNAINTCGFEFDTTYTKLPEHCFAHCNPTPAASPSIVIVNHQLASEIGLTFSQLSTQAQAALFSGTQLPTGATPFAQAYAGHQFGHFTMLGDGRALMWGEHITPDQTRLDIQFKGSGQTLYSRRADGRAVLGPMLREYIISEAMHHLGIATTRSLAVAQTGESVMREAALPGAILTRVASSHIRVGTFEFAASQDDSNLLPAILHYTIQRHYPDLNTENKPAVALIQAVMARQIDLIVNWMRVGFIHGVMNTDNMTLCGETIDYGPCAFMDNYHSNTVFSSIDHHGRYAYANQPKIAQWNLARLTETLLPLIDNDIDKAVEVAEQLITQCAEDYQQKWLNMMRAKLGLFGAYADDLNLITDLLKWMENTGADYTNTFRDLIQANKSQDKPYQHHAFEAWHKRWQLRLQQNNKPLASSWSLMETTNPAVIPRNHKVEQALVAAHNGDFNPCQALLEVLQMPYKSQEKLKPYQFPPSQSERIYQTFCGT